MSREGFSKQTGVRLKTLDHYVARHRREASSGSEPHQRWVAVEVGGQSSSGGELSVYLAGGRRIEVKRGFDPGTLRQLVAVLETA